MKYILLSLSAVIYLNYACSVFCSDQLDLKQSNLNKSTTYIDPPPFTFIDLALNHLIAPLRRIENKMLHLSFVNLKVKFVRKIVEAMERNILACGNTLKRSLILGLVMPPQNE